MKHNLTEQDIKKYGTIKEQKYLKEILGVMSPKLQMYKVDEDISLEEASDISKTSAHGMDDVYVLKDGEKFAAIIEVRGSTLRQAKGKYNGPIPERYRQRVVEIFEDLGLTDVDYAYSTGSDLGLDGQIH